MQTEAKTNWYEKYAEKVGVPVNHGEIADVVLEGLERNLTLYGARYCPCRVDRTRDTICPCREMRETKHCHCGLFA
jgi:ferredoxin-thioredoxin reductase catalytic subunit